MKLTMNIKHFLMLMLLVLAVAGCADDEQPSPSPIVTLTVDGAHTLRVGESLSLSAATSGASDSGYAWASAASDIASVDASGQVTGVAAGEAMITATGLDSGVSAEHVVVVTLPSDDPGLPVVTVAGTPFVAIGSSVTLTAATVNGEDAAYTWTSSDTAIAAVDGGVVTGLFAGETLITATGNDTGESGTLLVMVSAEVPYYQDWLGSAHADHTAEAFNHWNTEDPPEIPTDCARCHSTPGYVDYLADEIVDNVAPIGTVVECGACHNAAAAELEQVTFPSGVTVDGLGAEARCMVCHQGRASGDDVDEAIVTAGVASDDETSTSLGFLNIHYYAAGATINAGRVRGGYQYESEGAVYDWRFRHVPGYDNCVGCHDPHSLEVKVDDCAQCHQNVSVKDDLKNIRMIASFNQDYDGDGDLSEGIYYEIDGLRGLLLDAIKSYTVDEGIGAVCYDQVAYPYWFLDTDADGSCSSAEATYANRLASWTARLLKAAYNYQVSLKDPGAFAHNGKYIIQLLFDSISNLNLVLTTPIDMANAVRNDSGHFNGASEAARHWDEEEEVSASCSKCHGGSEGFRFFLQYGVGQTVQETDNGLDCATCHETFTPNSFDVVAVNSVLYPSAITVSDPGEISNVCAVCHSGRESMKTIDDKIAANQLGFRNVHYLPAAAVKKGNIAKVGYQYPSKTYAGEWTTHGNCVDCHSPLNTNHSFAINDNPSCTNGCHAGTPIANLRTNHLLDYDGDGNATEPLAAEIEGLAAALIAQMSVFGDITGPALCYDGHVNPYFFKDTNANGICESSEAVSANKYGPWNAGLMKAAHNYQISQKEPGAWAHNFDYMAQLLIDSIENLGGNVSIYVRP